MLEILLLVVTFFVISACVIVGIPVMILALIITIVVSFFIGCFYAIRNFIEGVSLEIDFRHWSWGHSSEPAVRSYFFGPGYEQLGETFSTTYWKNRRTRRVINDNADNWRYDDGWWGLAKKIIGTTYQIVTNIFMYFFSTTLCVVFAALLGSGITVYALVSSLVMAIIWLVDRIYLLCSHVRSDCPQCHHPVRLPHFRCPQCGVVHKALFPNPFGTWKHKCRCGHKIPAAFFNGRAKIAPLCPHCETPIATSNARPLVFQLIGGTKSGKTVFLSAFFHEFFERLQKNGISATVTEEYQPYFDSLRRWYDGANCPATSQRNAQMYPVLLHAPRRVCRQFSILDIAGEMFDGLTANDQIQQPQFHYCDGLLFLLDPFSGGHLRQQRISDGTDLSDFSSMVPEDVAAHFINYLTCIGHAKTSDRFTIPLSVIIAKADISEVAQAIGPEQVRQFHEADPEKYPSMQAAQDALCRQFLTENGMSAAVELLEARFTRIHYFPVSAMGHSPDGNAFAPRGVWAPVEWMLPLADSRFSKLLKTSPTE